MFSTMSSKVTIAIVVAMMMMMMTEAMPKHSSKTHKKDGAALKTIPLQLDPSAFSHTRSIRSLQNDSISPWTYNYTHDATLFPPVLSEARCLLRGCLDSEGQEDLSLESSPIMHQVLVLRRVRSSGAESGSGDGYHFRLESRLIAVGCTCVRANVKLQE
ncbi:interleukin 17a/f1 [Halichoeres trimaculatus]|uniref:interleukin 17a/f1 n=1 Tax=Halichoeres trimaculatus TaxID=147232 RepID=UPI003D9E5A17